MLPPAVSLSFSAFRVSLCSPKFGTASPRSDPGVTQRRTAQRGEPISLHQPTNILTIVSHAKREYVRAIIHLGVPMLAQATYSSPCPWLRQFHKCARRSRERAPPRRVLPGQNGAAAADRLPPPTAGSSTRCRDPVACHGHSAFTNLRADFITTEILAWS
jgi:hypothetical protein